MNQTGNFQPKGLQKLGHALFQSRSQREEAPNPGIGIYFKCIRAAKILSTIPKFGVVDWTGGFRMDRGRRNESAMNSVGVGPSPGTIMHNAERSNQISERSFWNLMHSRSEARAGNSPRTGSNFSADLRACSAAEDVRIPPLSRTVTDID